jgi:hypothetical protein
VVAVIERQDILFVSSNAPSGKVKLSESEEQAVIGMEQYLLAFAGYGLPPCDFDPDDEPAAVAEPIAVELQMPAAKDTKQA